MRKEKTWEGALTKQGGLRAAWLCRKKKVVTKKAGDGLAGTVGVQSSKAVGRQASQQKASYVAEERYVFFLLNQNSIPLVCLAATLLFGTCSLVVCRVGVVSLTAAGVGFGGLQRCTAQSVWVPKALIGRGRALWTAVCGARGYWQRR